MRCVVTGCAGFIGSHLCERLTAEGHSVVGVDCLTDYYDPRLKRRNLRRLTAHPRLRFVEADLVTADLATLLADAELIFHLAATPGVRQSWGESFAVYTRNNITATQRLLEAVRDKPLKKFVYASSSSVYGVVTQPPTSETALTRPLSPYGVTKLAGENLSLLYHANYGVPVVALRFFTVYGPRQRPDMAFYKFIRAALDDEPLTVFGDGNFSRDFTYVADAVDGVVRAAMRKVVGEVFNLGARRPTTVRQTIAMLEGILGKPVQVHHTNAQKGDVPATLADIHKAQSLLGYQPKTSLEEGLAQEVAWMKEERARG